jgi:CRISPR-associated protein Cmr1
MTSLTFHCEVITPMFLGGANPAKTELRAASVKGALRFWWRAMHGELPLDELKKRESEIFGGVGDNARRSGISIRVKEGDNFQTSTEPFSPNPYLDRSIFKKHRTRNRTEAKLLILEYLAFGPVTLEGGIKTYHEYIIPGSQFKIEFVGKDASLIKAEITGALRLLSVFGGLGSRSRNGFGRFKCSCPEMELPDLTVCLKALKEKPVSPFTSVSIQSNLWKLDFDEEVPNDWNNILYDLGCVWLKSRVNYENKRGPIRNGIENEHQFGKRVFLGAPLIGDNRQQNLRYGDRSLKFDRHAKSHFFGLFQNEALLEGYILHLPYLFLEGSNDEYKLHDADIKLLQKEYEKVFKEFNSKLPLQYLTQVTL